MIGAGFTVEFWENAPFSGSPRSAFSWNNGIANGVFLYISGNTGVFNVPDNAGNGHQFNVASVFDGTWRHVALTYDRVAGAKPKCI